jgi:hypothetical protein
MTNIDADLTIEGLLTPQESVEKMLAVILGKTIDDTGTFWTWEGKVSTEPFHLLLAGFCSSAYSFPSSASRCSYGLFQPILLALVSKKLTNKALLQVHPW